MEIQFVDENGNEIIEFNDAVISISEINCNIEIAESEDSKKLLELLSENS
jgi:hypothetical protein